MMELGTRTKRIVLFVGGVGVMTSVLVAAACSSDSSTSSGALPGVDANTDTNSPPPPPPPPPVGDDGGDGGDGGVDCSKAPKLRNNTTDYYCAFVDKGDGGGGFDGGNPEYCGNDELCCNPGGLYADGGHFPSYCAPDPASNKPSGNPDAVCAAESATKNSAWDAGGNGGDTYECADKNNCGAGKVCCMYDNGTAIQFADLLKSGSTPIPAACGAKYAKNIKGTKCETGTTCAPGAGEYVMCSLTDTCAAGTCTPFSGFFRDLGYCK
jgi:hypothetical protein